MSDLTDETRDALIADRAITLKAAAKIIARAALDLFAEDQHRWSSRPCGTCRKISKLLNEPWGCYEFQAKQSQT